MRLSESLADQVPAGVRERGRRYHRQGAVDLLSADVDEASAHVFGNSRYSVRLALGDDGLAISCDCPYFEGGSGTCKHIWATLLDAEEAGFGGAGLYIPSRNGARRPGSAPAWATKLGAIEASQRTTPSSSWPADREIIYILDVQDALAGGGPSLDVAHRDRKRDGSWGKLKHARIGSRSISQLNDSSDRQILAMLVGAQDSWSAAYGYYSGYSTSRLSSKHMSVPASIVDPLIPLVCLTGRGRLRLDPSDEDLLALRWDDGPPWQLVLQASLDDEGRHHEVGVRLQRGDERMALEEPLLLLSSGFVFARDGTVARLAHSQSFEWISLIRKDGPIVVSVDQTDEFLDHLLGLPSLPELDLPDSLAYEEVQATPRPRLQIHPAGAENRLRGALSFDYGGMVIASDDEGRGSFQAERRRFVLRDRAAEDEASETLSAQGFRRDRLGNRELAPRHLPRVVRTLLECGWHVEAEGKVYKAARSWNMSVSSGIDWFELTGGVEFGETTASFPELLAALRRGENFVALDDGTLGMLPEEWLERYGPLAGVGTVTGDGLRFKRTQVGILDALLASRPEVTVDDVFLQARDQMRAIENIEPMQEPSGFVGELRGYQREGLGWLDFLQRFGFGGCLADDMGLGKTVQVLALLELRRKLRGKRNLRPSLVVVPKSLVFNWRQEAERFTPKLKVLDHTGTRLPPGEHFEGYDVVLTTYGTLRRDAPLFADVAFDYCILDEAQTIKNASTASAKAARLIRADHRLALSGTPIENHLGELWSLFEFLDPGILGSAKAFGSGLNGDRTPDTSTLSRALRPFILRRTKDQVAADLPPKSEQTLFCELPGSQRTHYNKLRDHFRRDLLERVDRNGINRSKMLVLEALLRLRQAACHTGLIDPSKAHEPSAKINLLIPQLLEVCQEGHKALVFSQFTKLLAIVRDRLDREGVLYEYLDGRTKNRHSRVERFQSDPERCLFLISLKAGGLGLNLTAAEYVFLLDPWWNPAVEAQAIDRTHRIGQTRPVFAYRIIARDTVEEEILELQESKRALADSIITADNSLIRHLRREDLELLMS